jgi:hypothetical protein
MWKRFLHFALLPLSWVMQSAMAPWLAAFLVMNNPGCLLGPVIHHSLTVVNMITSALGWKRKIKKSFLNDLLILILPKIRTFLPNWSLFWPFGVNHPYSRWIFGSNIYGQFLACTVDPMHLLEGGWCTRLQKLSSVPCILMSNWNWTYCWSVFVSHQGPVSWLIP